MEEVTRKTPPSGFAFNVGNAFCMRCKWALQLTAQHWEPSTATTCLGTPTDLVPLVFGAGINITEFCEFSISLECSELELRIVTAGSTHSIRDYDIKTAQAVDCILHQSIAVTLNPHILGSLADLELNSKVKKQQYRLNDGGLHVMLLPDLLCNFIGAVFTCIIIDGDIAAFLCEFFCYEGTQSSAIAQDPASATGLCDSR